MYHPLNLIWISFHKKVLYNVRNMTINGNLLHGHITQNDSEILLLFLYEFCFFFLSKLRISKAYQTSTNLAQTK